MGTSCGRDACDAAYSRAPGVPHLGAGHLRLADGDRGGVARHDDREQPTAAEIDARDAADARQHEIGSGDQKLADGRADDGNGLAKHPRRAPKREHSGKQIALTAGIVEHRLTVPDVDLRARRRGELLQRKLRLLGHQRHRVVLAGAREGGDDVLAELLLVAAAELVRPCRG